MSKAQIHGGFLLLAHKIILSALMNWPGHYMKLWIWMLSKASYSDGIHLKRGQLLTSIAEMQEVGGYMVGFRKRVLTKGEVRSAYEALTKNTMISTTKTTRGMIITILNYTLYQDFKSYEEHSEQHDEHATNNKNTTQDSKSIEIIKRKDSKAFVPPSVDSVHAYMESIGYDGDAQRFVDHYTTNGWVVGKSKAKMKDWQSAVRTWRSNGYVGTVNNIPAKTFNQHPQPKTFDQIRNDANVDTLKRFAERIENGDTDFFEGHIEIGGNLPSNTVRSGDGGIPASNIITIR